MNLWFTREIRCFQVSLNIDPVEIIEVVTEGDKLRRLRQRASALHIELMLIIDIGLNVMNKKGV